MKTPAPFPAPVAIVGLGRAGAALAAALGTAVATRLWDRDATRLARLAPRVAGTACATLHELLAGARSVLVCVSDAAVGEVAAALDAAWPARGGPRVVLHTAGALSSRALDPLRRRAAGRGVFHPVVALRGPESAPVIAGAFATISGDARARRTARALAHVLGLQVAQVDDARRPLVHAAAVMAAGDLVALLAEAERIAQRAGVARGAARALIAALAAGAVDGFGRDGLAALTGPVARGDATTLAAHAAALARAGTAGRAALELHRALARTGAARLQAAGRLGARDARRVCAALELPVRGRPRTLLARRSR